MKEGFGNYSRIASYRGTSIDISTLSHIESYKKYDIYPDNCYHYYYKLVLKDGKDIEYCFNDAASRDDKVKYFERELKQFHQFEAQKERMILEDEVEKRVEKHVDKIYRIDAKEIEDLVKTKINEKVEKLVIENLEKKIKTQLEDRKIEGIDGLSRKSLMADLENLIIEKQKEFQSDIEEARRKDKDSLLSTLGILTGALFGIIVHFFFLKYVLKL